MDRLPASEGKVEQAALAPNGRLLAVVCAVPGQWGGRDRRVEVLDRVDGTRRTLIAGDDAMSIVWSPDSRFLWVFSYRQKRGWLFQPEEGMSWAIPSGVMEWDHRRGTASFVDWGFVEAAGARVLRLTHLLPGGRRRRWLDLGGNPQAAAFSRDRRLIGYTGGDSDLWVYDIAKRTRRRFTNTPEWQEIPVFFSPDGRLVVAWVLTDAIGTGQFEAWEVSTGRRLVPELPEVFRADMGSHVKVRWWAPLSEPPPDCRPWVRKTLGPGVPTRFDGAPPSKSTRP